jgi:hypothetical protein
VRQYWRSIRSAIFSPLVPRATYFRALLEVSDLETFRTEVSAFESTLKPPDDPLLVKLAAAVSIPLAAPSLRRLTTDVPSITEVAAALDGAVCNLIEAEGIDETSTFDDRLVALAELLTAKQSRTFPVKDFDRKPPPAAAVSQDKAHAAQLNEYLTERAKVDRETRRLTGLFKELLKLPAVEHAHDPLDCPVCGTAAALTPARLAIIRQNATDTEAFQVAEARALAALQEIGTTLDSLSTAIGAALPSFMLYTAKIRRQRAFRIERVKLLLGQEGSETLAPWLAALRPFVKAQRRAASCVASGKLVIAALAANLETVVGIESVDEIFVAAGAAIDDFASAAGAYAAAELPLTAILKKAVDRESLTAGWQDLIDLARGQEPFRASLIERAVLNDLRKEFQQALKQIDKGNENVLEEKFADLSVGVQAWWDLLRPGEHSFFAAVKPRPNARRSIDFKAGLGDGGDRKAAKLRDVIAVFSQSQLHCLGLAVFLARAVHEKAGFLVLDDPILASDEDYRTYFKRLVMERLVEHGIQTVVLTQCKDTWRDIFDLHGHHGVATFQIKLSDQKSGTSVTPSNDEFLAMLTQIEPYTMHNDLEIRKAGGAKIRVTTERFCKLLLVRKAREGGNPSAVITDYAGKGLDDLIPLVTAHLERTDPSHVGKLRVIRRDTNPANHDDEVPTVAALRTGLGDLRDFRKRYLI